MSSSSFNPEPKARRTHARRSCNTCKVRKTRCELPDLDVPSSNEALPPEKACHRCRILTIPCVVDDSKMKKRKKKDGSPSPIDSANDSASGSKPAAAPPSKSDQPTKRTRSGRKDDDAKVNIVDHSVDVSAAFPIDTDSSGLPGAWMQQGARDSPQAIEASKVRSVRLHGRPLSLVAAMLNIASTKMRGQLKRRIITIEDIDLEQLIDARLRSRLAAGYAQLRAYHPHLQPLDELFSLNRSTPGDESIHFLLSVAAFIASQSLSNEPEARRVREHLSTCIYHLQHVILAHQPLSFHAIQALEILALHAPFAPALPFLLADPRTLAPARGLIGAAISIANAVSLDRIAHGPIDSWGNLDFWLWLGIRIGEAQVALEDERLRKPDGLATARGHAASFMSPEGRSLWKSAAASDDPAELLGKLTYCDRLGRLEELHETIVRLRNVLENAATVPNYNATQVVQEELEYYNQRMVALDERHDEVLAIISPPRHLDSGWKAYREIRRRFEIMKAHMMAMQTLLALHFLYGSHVALNNLPTPMNAAMAIAYAINRSCKPEDILIAYSTRSPAAEALRNIASVRGELAEQQLGAFVELANQILPAHGGGADIVPIHEIIAVTVESAKALMEQQASRLAFLRDILQVSNGVQLPDWAATMSRASLIMRNLATLRVDEDLGGENISNGCSNILGSMCRIVQEWGIHDSGAESIPAAPRRIMHISQQFNSSQSPDTSTQARSSPALVDSNGMLQLVPPAGMTGFQGYMDTSDRWMASDNDRLPLMPQYQQSNLDHLLSEMFGYGYGTLGPAPSPQALFDATGQHPQLHQGLQSHMDFQGVPHVHQ